MKTKRIIYTTLLILWMIIIFCFSNQTGEESQLVSNKIVNGMINIIDYITDNRLSVEEISLIVRKLAHFTIYFILGILAFLTLNSYGVRKPLIFSIILCLLYAITDEIHQLFVNGRYGSIIDVMIDSFGSIIGIIASKKVLVRN